MVSPKKHLGQHFLRDENIARKIADALTHAGYERIVEIGPGTGVLTRFLPQEKLSVIELDDESVSYLRKHHPDLNILPGDFLKMHGTDWHHDSQTAVIGNFPYNISSQIVFTVLDNRDHVPEVVGMFQKEVAERIASKHGNKVYGILSVLTQVFYDVAYLFTVNENVFDPPPKVKSGVIRMTRKLEPPDCDEKLLFQVVKMSFNQRRKMLRGTLKSLIGDKQLPADLLAKRPEQLSIAEFVSLTKLLQG